MWSCGRAVVWSCGRVAMRPCGRVAQMAFSSLGRLVAWVLRPDKYLGGHPTFWSVGGQHFIFCYQDALAISSRGTSGQDAFQRVSASSAQGGHPEAGAWSAEGLQSLLSFPQSSLGGVVADP